VFEVLTSVRACPADAPAAAAIHASLWPWPVTVAGGGAVGGGDVHAHGAGGSGRAAVQRGGGAGALGGPRRVRRRGVCGAHAAAPHVSARRNGARACHCAIISLKYHAGISCVTVRHVVCVGGQRVGGMLRYSLSKPRLTPGMAAAVPAAFAAAELDAVVEVLQS
jgi:hypothetical protein